ncbi:MAG: adenylate kinase family protein [Methanobacterium sp.]|uniref:adenylate kinase family protein n=1 Tax=Methanobacterium sp. TaxID=2164 RepID=UPI003C72D131
MAAVIITGTPGTGKTTVSKIVSKTLNTPLIALNELIIDKHLYNGHDDEKGYKIVDMEALSSEINLILDSTDKQLIIEGHLAHDLGVDEKVDTVIVLRARPSVLRDRLKKREWPDSKIQENVEAEALDLCTFESVETHGDKVHEVDTSDLDVDDVSEIIIQILNGNKQLPPGKINFLEELF